MYIYPAEENDNGDYIIDVDFNDYLYLIDENDIKRIFKPKEELIEKEEKLQFVGISGFERIRRKN